MLRCSQSVSYEAHRGHAYCTYCKFSCTKQFLLHIRSKTAMLKACFCAYNTFYCLEQYTVLSIVTFCVTSRTFRCLKQFSRLKTSHDTSCKFQCPLQTLLPTATFKPCSFTPESPYQSLEQGSISVELRNYDNRINLRGTHAFNTIPM